MVHEKTIQVRIQIIDIKPQVLDVRVPVYLKAADLSQRIARDAGLQAFWPNRRRKLYWMRARGRLMHEDETLESMGVIDNELIYLLPQPLPEMGVVEQDPEYPQFNNYLGQGIPLLVLILIAVVFWALGWGLAMTASKHWTVAVFPALGAGVLTVSFSRHAWGGRASRPRVFAAAFVLYLLMISFSVLTPVALGQDFRSFLIFAVAGYVTGPIAILVSWLAWWGAVEPLPMHVEEEEQQQAEEFVCAICLQPIDLNVDIVCEYQCGRHFHVGCHEARMAVYRGPNDFCGVCHSRLALNPQTQKYQIGVG